jgi:hypothetical protein
MTSARCSVSRIVFEAEDEATCEECHRPIVGPALLYEARPIDEWSYRGAASWIFHEECGP